MMSVETLPSVPSSWVDSHGTPRYGTYAGELPEMSLAALGPSLSPGFPNAILRRKRWHYTLIGTPEVLVVMAIADVGYAANGFLAAVDLAARSKLLDVSYLGLPGPLARVGDHPGPGLSAEIWGAGGHLRARRPGANPRYQVEADVLTLRSRYTKLRAEVLVAGGPPALTVISPVAGGVVNVTQKHAGLLTFGSFEFKGRTYSLDGGVAGMDYSHGLLARHTAWRWAMGAGRLADGTPLGFNLVEGFNEGHASANENALWVGGKVVPLGRARFTFNRNDVLEPWAITTPDREVDLRFRAFHVHRDMRDLKVIKSHFLQPLGVFRGSIVVGGQRLVIDDVPGVTEDQDMVW